MPPRSLLEMRGPEAKSLASLASIRSDLELAKTLLERIDIGADNILNLACFWAALIAYRRCFNSGVRSNLSESDIAPLVGGASKVHRFIRDQADKLIAHSVNPFEEMKVGVDVQDGAILGAGAFVNKLSHYSPEGLQGIKTLIDLTLGLVEKRMKAAHDKLIEKAKRMSPEELAALPKLSIRLPEGTDAGKSRKH